VIEVSEGAFDLDQPIAPPASITPGGVGVSDRDQAICAITLSILSIRSPIQELEALNYLTAARRIDFVTTNVALESRLAAELSVELLPGALSEAELKAEEWHNNLQHLQNSGAIIRQQGLLRPGSKFAEKRSFYGQGVDDWVRFTMSAVNAASQPGIPMSPSLFGDET
jgi:hypothetical protein